MYFCVIKSLVWHFWKVFDSKLKWQIGAIGCVNYDEYLPERYFRDNCWQWLALCGIFWNFLYNNSVRHLTWFFCDILTAWLGFFLVVLDLPSWKGRSFDYQIFLQVFDKRLTMKLDGAGDGPPNRDGSNNYSRQMAELVLREKQAKKRQVRIYIQNVFFWKL